MDQMQIARQHEISKLQSENEQMRQLATRQGFYTVYFQECKTAASNVEAFNKVNDLYHSLFGEYRYSDHNSFKAMQHYYGKKHKK